MEKETKIYGIRAIIEAIEAQNTIDKVFLQKGLKGALFSELESLLRKNHINTSYVPIEKLNRLTPYNHQGAVAQISPVPFYEIETLINTVKASKSHPFFLLLDQVNDVRNFGAIIRTAECTGVDGIIIQNRGSAPINGDTIKTSAVVFSKMETSKMEVLSGWLELMTLLLHLLLLKLMETHTIPQMLHLLEMRSMSTQAKKLKLFREVPTR